MTIPEIGTQTATHPPIAILTSNRTRDLHDALKRRCLYHWIDYPSLDKEIEIVRQKVPGLEDKLGREIVAFVQSLRRQDLYKLPGIAETLDWAVALGHLNTVRLDPDVVAATLDFIDRISVPVNKLPEQTITDPLEHQVWLSNQATSYAHMVQKETVV